MKRFVLVILLLVLSVSVLTVEAKVFKGTETINSNTYYSLFEMKAPSMISFTITVDGTFLDGIIRVSVLDETNYKLFQQQQQWSSYWQSSFSNTASASHLRLNATHLIDDYYLVLENLSLKSSVTINYEIEWDLTPEQKKLVGIIIGCVVGAIAVCCVCICACIIACCCCKKRRKATTYTNVSYTLVAPESV
eukprot:GEZU01037120.1.p1 GENE.GEZU01037120.1~~GEZU01037120.1.p1  ORF type:complete len:192 (-),score=39.89 GEZU01037120.1:193-768(-)